MYMYPYRMLLWRQSRHMLQIGLLFFSRIHFGVIDRRWISHTPSYRSHPLQRRPGVLGNRKRRRGDPLFAELIDSTLRHRRGFLDTPPHPVSIRRNPDTGPSIIESNRLGDAGRCGEFPRRNRVDKTSTGKLRALGK